MDDVARRAGVGVGTVYRHFPTKEALVEALALDLFERVLAAGRAALRARGPVGGVRRTRCGPARSCCRPTARSRRSSARPDDAARPSCRAEINDDLRAS